MVGYRRRDRDVGRVGSERKAEAIAAAPSVRVGHPEKHALNLRGTRRKQIGLRDAADDHRADAESRHGSKLLSPSSSPCTTIREGLTPFAIAIASSSLVWTSTAAPCSRTHVATASSRGTFAGKAASIIGKDLENW